MICTKVIFSSVPLPKKVDDRRLPSTILARVGSVPLHTDFNSPELTRLYFYKCRLIFALDSSRLLRRISATKLAADDSVENLLDRAGIQDQKIQS